MTGLGELETKVLLQLFELRAREPLRGALLWYEHEYHTKPATGVEQVKAKFGTEGLDRILDLYRWFELGGVLVKRGALPADVFFDLFGSPHRYWDALEPVIRELRKTWDAPKLCENFEALAARGRSWESGGR